MFAYIKKAQYHETDQMGFIHHANYVKWMEEARLAYLETLGLGYQQVENEKIFSPVVSIAVRYKSPVHFADEVEIRVTVKAYTSVKLELAYEFFNKTSQTVCAEASSLHCFIRNGKVISLKKDMPALHGKLFALAPGSAK
ncbi:acyl-CoA thioesterase [Candidatus Avelusimicrobium caledoniensis]|uniref:acyl-CoA thioesterase n=1 Tax=Candidatus Avelusimicrobium caledoniensis TaxID=3416220 RepID=UPI003D09F629